MRRVSIAAALLVTLVPGVVLAAEGGGISFESGIDFRALKTFAIRDGRIDSPKPEVDNRLFRQRMDDSIRATLTKKGLREVAQAPDIIVTFQFSDADYSDVERRAPIRVPGIPGQQRGFVIQGSGPRPVLYTEGTLVIDIHDSANRLIWRGTHRNRERSGPTLSRKLSEDARRLLSKYPPWKK